MRVKNIVARSFNLSLNGPALVMGIVNVTPNSFSGDGKWVESSSQVAVRYALKMVKDGADIIDVGGESTRPGAKSVSIEEEIKRVVPVIQKLSTKINIPISIDSYKPEVIKAALEAGASMVNVIQGTPINTKIVKIVRDYKAAIVLMHMRGNPQTMMEKTRYRNIILEITKSLEKSVEKCLKSGIKKECIIVDPGIGFAKDGAQNFLLIKYMKAFNIKGCPVLIGPSRKSFIGKALGLLPKDLLAGTVAAVSASLMNGARIVRVHDIKSAKHAAVIINNIQQAAR